MPEHRLYVTTRTLWPYSKSPVLVALIRFHFGDQQKNSVQRSDKRTAPETRKAPSNKGASFIGSSHSLTGVRSTTVFKCVATPGVKWCHVLQRADFEAKTSPNLVPRVAKWWNVWPHLGHISEAAGC